MSKRAVVGCSLVALVALCVGTGIVISNSVASADTDDYDSNGNGILEKDEVLAVLIDYFLDEITQDEVLAVLIRYFLNPPTPTPSSTPTPTPTPTPYRGDTMAPNLAALTLDRSAVHVGYADRVIRVTARATDDLSGVTYVDVRFKSPSGNQSVMMQNARRSSGTTLNGTYVGTMTVLRYSEPGTWRLDSAWVSDRIGNSRQYDAAELARLGLSVSFEVSGAYITGSGLRPQWEWTADNPATFEEIEAELEKYRGSSLNVASWGGAYQAAQRQAYFLPFQEKFGIQIVEDSPVEYAKIRSMVETGNVIWDVVDSGVRAVQQLGPWGELEWLTPAIHNGYLSGYPEVAKTPWSGGGGVVWSTGLAYQKDKINTLWDGKKPNDWTAFWDVQNFPGTRWMGRRVNENVLFAHFNRTPEILDTVEGRTAIAKLTDEQVDQSFEELERIKPHIQFWWTGGTDCPHGLITDQVDMCTAWNGRIWNAQQEEGGDNLHYCYECGHITQTDVFYIPKGSPNKELAELFIAWTGFPEINVEISNYISYGPLNTDAIQLTQSRVNQRFIPALPTSPIALEKAVIVDEKWLGTNLDALAERMEAFLADVTQ